MEDTTYEGDLVDGENRINNIGSAYECQVKCQEHQECKYFVWKKKSKRCSLKKIPTKGNLAGIIDGCGKKCKGKVTGPKFCSDKPRW